MEAFLEPHFVEEVVEIVAVKLPEEKKTKIKGQANAIVKELKAGKWKGFGIEVCEDNRLKLIEVK